mmetsp:Transcript_2829/g.5804  ORF Transcript_2829/g.5804 Transcript_2829/m.5804 type:complete len:207 (+) Transcript_2829:181-801(+)
MSLQDAAPRESRIALVTGQREHALGTHAAKLSERPANTAAIGHSYDDSLRARVARGEGVRHERRNEVAVTRLHLAPVDNSMLVLVVEVHGTNEEGCLHHEVAIVELYIWVQWIAAPYHSQLLDPLRPELAAPAHGGVPVLVVGRPAAGPVQPVQHPGRRLPGFPSEEAHTAHSVISIEPQVVQRHRVGLAHLSQNIKGVTELKVTF